MRSRRSGKLELLALVGVLEVPSGLVRTLGVLGAPKMPDLVWVSVRGCEGPNRSSTNRNTESIGLGIG